MKIIYFLLISGILTCILCSQFQQINHNLGDYFEGELPMDQQQYLDDQVFYMSEISEQLSNKQMQRQYQILLNQSQYINISNQVRKQDVQYLRKFYTNQQLKSIFNQYQQKYSKNYEESEQNFRFQIYKNNLKYIKKHNSQNHSYQVDANKFADLTDSQFRLFYLMNPNEINPFQTSVKLPQNLKESESQQYNGISDYSLDKISLRKLRPIDWRQKIMFSPIKDQGKCSSCYAFSLVGALQLNWAIKNKKKVPILSQQQIIDCCQQYGYKCKGCKSGNIPSAFQYITQNGIAQSQNYPYKRKAQRCKLNLPVKRYTNSERPFQKISGLLKTIEYLVNRGPLSVGVDGSRWKFYKKGVFANCPKDKLRYQHSAVLVGITKNGTWIIRNSWGPDWGQEGYIRIARGNSCGLSKYVYLPIAS